MMVVIVCMLVGDRQIIYNGGAAPSCSDRRSDTQDIYEEQGYEVHKNTLYIHINYLITQSTMRIRTIQQSRSQSISQHQPCLPLWEEQSLSHSHSQRIECYQQ